LCISFLPQRSYCSWHAFVIFFLLIRCSRFSVSWNFSFFLLVPYFLSLRNFSVFFTGEANCFSVGPLPPMICSVVLFRSFKRCGLDLLSLNRGLGKAHGWMTPPPLFELYSKSISSPVDPSEIQAATPEKALRLVAISFHLTYTSRFWTLQRYRFSPSPSSCLPGRMRV